MAQTPSALGGIPSVPLFPPSSGTPPPSGIAAQPASPRVVLKNKIGEFAENVEKGKPIACYGFFSNQQEIQKALKAMKDTHSLGTAFTMNDLNKSVGIGEPHAVAFLSFIHEHKATLEGIADINARISEYCRMNSIVEPAEGSIEKQWLGFAMEHLSALDIEGKLKNLAQAASTPAPPRLPPSPSRLDYVKGSDPNLGNVLESFICKNTKKPKQLMPDLTTWLKTPPPLPPSLPPPPPQSLNSTLSRAFFRQTSKLGLQFCAQQGIPIAFAWDPKKGEAGKALDAGWLSTPAAGQRRNVRGFIPITGSEMRTALSEPSIGAKAFAIGSDGTPPQSDIPKGLERGTKLP